MIGIVSNSNNPYVNFAIEKYLLEKFTNNFIFFYQNHECIIVGRNQIIAKEINNEFVRERKMSILRRISGGGAVYHDLGNVNYSFIVNRKRGEKRTTLFNYIISRFIRREFGVKIQITDDNLFYNNKKLSGTAQYFKGGRQIHHGTFLVDSNIKKLKKSLNNNNYLKYSGNAQSSKKKDVMNFNDIINKRICFDDIIKLIENYLSVRDFREFITDGDKIMEQEIESFNWFYDKEPFYSFENDFTINEEKIYIYFDIIRNRITNFRSNKKYLNDMPFNGCNHNFENIINIVKDSKMASFFVWGELWKKHILKAYETAY